MASSSQASEPLLRHASAEEDGSNIAHHFYVAELERKYESLKYLLYALVILYDVLVIVYIFLVKDIVQPRQRLCPTLTDGTIKALPEQSWA